MTNRHKRTLTILLLSFTLAIPLSADEVTKWDALANQIALNSGLADLHPLFQTRMLAIMHIAMHDAVNAIDRRYDPYVLHIPPTPGASPEAAAATAAYVTLQGQLSQIAAFGFPPQLGEVSAAYASSLAAVPDGQAKTLGIAIGQAAASQILALRAGDGAYQLPVIDPNYVEGTRPGEYRFTPPFTFVFEPQWGTLVPFALDRGDRFRSSHPYSILSKQYAGDYNEIKALGGDGVSTASSRTADQTQIALFWVESSPVGWNRIARTVSSSKGLNLWQNAYLFALLNMALADGYIASFDTKYFFNFWRPITAIRDGNVDGNPDTAGDPAWTPLVTTPPIPDHDSAHTVEGAAAAEVMQLVLGNASFQTCSTTLPAGQRCGDATPVYRSYSSFVQAAQENGVSRIYVGFHFRRAVDEGMQHGQKIGHWAVQKHLRPIR